MAFMRMAGWATAGAALVLGAALSGCQPTIATEPNTIHTAAEAEIPSGYGIYMPHPDNAGVFVKTNSGIKYFDEDGFLHQVYEDEKPERTFYLAWQGRRTWMVFLKPDGTFPTAEEARKQNILEAAPVVQASRQITFKQIDGCLDRARKDVGPGKTLNLAGGFEVDEGRIFRGPRLPVEVQAPVRIGKDGLKSFAPDQLVCEFEVVDGAPVFRGVRILKP